jgi:hypothetical protein
MPFRTITVEGTTWRAQPSGNLTANYKDEFTVIFARGEGAECEQRVTRYSPQTSRWREESFVQLSDEDLLRLFYHSQPSVTSPETFYSR